MHRVVVTTDGYAGTYGVSWAFIATGPPGTQNVRESGTLSPNVPSHVAEWTAAKHALTWAESTLHRGDNLELRTDSALVAKGLASRRPEMSGEAAHLRAECRQALTRLANAGIHASVTRIRREENEDADTLAREALGLA